MSFSFSCAVFEPYDVVLYEKVSLVPDFKRKTLVLIGAQCIGRRQLKSRLVEDEPDKYGEVKACECLVAGPVGLLSLLLLLQPSSLTLFVQESCVFLMSCCLC